MRVTVLGDGAWGTAMAMLLADNGHQVTVWCYSSEVAHAIKRDACNMVYFPDVALDTTSIRVVTDIREAIKDAEIIFEAIPVRFLRSVLQNAKPHTTPKKIWVVLSKGIEEETLLVPSQLITQLSGNECLQVILSGPSFAKDLAQKQITGVMLAATDSALIESVRACVENSYFRVTPTFDLLGVQLCGALKNVVALAIGILDGAGHGDNTKILCIMRCLDEIVRIVEVQGGHKKTVYDLAGLGDLMLTALGRSSKNFAFGRSIGSGMPFLDAATKISTVPEGVTTSKSIAQLIERYKIDAPLLQAVYRTMLGQEPLDFLIHHLRCY